MVHYKEFYKSMKERNKRKCFAFFNDLNEYFIYKLFLGLFKANNAVRKEAKIVRNDENR